MWQLFKNPQRSSSESPNLCKGTPCTQLLQAIFLSVFLRKESGEPNVHCVPPFSYMKDCNCDLERTSSFHEQWTSHCEKCHSFMFPISYLCHPMLLMVRKFGFLECWWTCNLGAILEIYTYFSYIFLAKESDTT